MNRQRWRRKIGAYLEECQKSKQPEAHNYSFIYFFLFIMHMQNESLSHLIRLSRVGKQAHFPVILTVILSLDLEKNGMQWTKDTTEDSLVSRN